MGYALQQRDAALAGALRPLPRNLVAQGLEHVEALGLAVALRPSGDRCGGQGRGSGGRGAGGGGVGGAGGGGVGGR